MRIKVYAPSNADRSYLDEDSFLHTTEALTVNDVMKLLNLSFLRRRISIISVNNKLAKKNHRLSDGDILSFYEMRAGG